MTTGVTRFEDMIRTSDMSRLPIPLGSMGDMAVKRLPLR